ncbi:F0F1 ATP synthase subunit B [Entomomonas asaccharolytica]|uniref:ATP synthase subunit b n=1 Tax=Entomomonas asaccharolytica TaxID=2785331 RepID=A0A974RWY1_9GAMM|nr:F0F1 ATP synthase subunit B [Entomomonas asaccharolytica]QQP85653.1 F0F1 ATP synthase subunit B [Entomomonas asaccharolytica]
MNINLTLIGQTIAFAIFVLFCMKYVWPPINQVMQERKKKIAEGLDAAGRAERELQEVQQQVEQILREGKEQAADILDKANKTASSIIEESKQQARTEGEKLIASARSEIDLEVNRARDQLRSQVASLAVQGAEKILESSVDANAHSDLVDKIASKL